MVLSNVIVHFEPGEPTRQDVEISNTGSEPMYVEIEPAVVLSAGTAQEDRSPISDPRDAGLLVTPNKLIVPPGATKVIRLVKLGPSFSERIYRIAARPVAGPLESAEQSGVKILVGYEILAIVYPNNPQPDLQVERQGQQLVMRNNGNTNVLLREGYQCVTPDMPKEQCTALPGKRMYPGNEWTLDLPEDLPVTYYQSVGSRNFIEQYP
ncbi:MAG: hypothetical protein AAF993_00475 [Pseudomonadota bacterium]